MAGLIRRTAALAGAVAVLLVPGAAPAGAAAASDAAQAARDARTLSAQSTAAAAAATQDVAALRAELRAALQLEEQALLGLGAGLQADVEAERRADAADARADAVTAQHARAVRDLYVTGGPLAVWSSLLASGSPQDLVQRRDAAGRLLAALDSSARRAGAERAGAATAAHRAAGAATRAATTVADVERAGERVTAALQAARTRQRVLGAQAAAAGEAERAAVQRAVTALAVAQREAAARRVTAGGHAVARAGAAGVPADYATLYRQAASTRCPGMRWTLLAAVGQVESRHGADTGPSSAGAVGPMQFMPATFAAYGVDGDGDGTADPWRPADAVHSAAAYLCGGGAGEGTAAGDRRALLRYNRADWYVDLVLGVEADLLDDPAAAVP